MSDYRPNPRNLKIVPYAEDQTDHGYFFSTIVPEGKQVDRTPENDHCFFYDRSVDHFVVARLGSAMIVSLLEIHRSVDEVRAENNESSADIRRPLAFFDLRGAFYGSGLLHGLYPNVDANGASGTKHTAIFEPTGAGKGEPFAIAIDSLHFLTMAKPDPNARV